MSGKILMRLDYDDQLDGAIEKVNDALSIYNLKFEYSTGGDGFVMYELKEIGICEEIDENLLT